MIRLTRMTQMPFVLNAELIEYVDATPDTVISLANNQKVLVKESVDVVVARVIEYRRAINGTASAPSLEVSDSQGEGRHG